MEKLISAKRKRNFVRRLIAPVTSIALLSAGGWGAHEYYNQQPTEGLSEQSAIAHSAPTPKAELKLLFSSDKVDSSAKQANSEKPTTAQFVSSTVEDRYSSKVKPTSLTVAPPELPPIAKTETKTLKSTNQTPLSTPTSSVGDRYASVLAPSTAPPVQEPAEKVVAKPTIEPTEDATTDIARGQEPGVNSLRSNPAPSNLDARAAFGQALAQAPKTTPPTTSNQLDAALQQARPLQPSTPGSSSRYGSSAAPVSTAPTTKPLQPSLQTPAPPIKIQSEPPQPQLATAPQNPFGQKPVVQKPVGQSPVGGPPVGLTASRVPPQPVIASPPVQNNLARRDLGPSLAPPTPTPGLANHPGTGRPGESLLEGAQSPSITIQKLSPEEIQVGKRCTFAIRVQNTGQRTAQNVQIRDEIPLGTELVGTAPRANVSGTDIVWDLGTLSPGEQRTVEMELLPREEGELGSVATVSIAAQASAKSRCTRPELALRLSAQPQVHIGEQHIVQIEISNPGSGDATGVMLLENIPAGVSHEAGPSLEFEVGTLRAGETRSMDLILTAEQAGQINNVMTARADASLQVEASCQFEVIAPELQLSIDGPKRRFLERPATYRVSIDNPGTASATDVQLVTHLPKGMQFVSANNMGEYDSSSHSVHWSLAELPANERGTVELVALPIEPGSQTLQVATKAKEGLEDQTDQRVMVEGLSALMFEVVDVEGLIEVGGETTYEIRVRNQGSKAASNVQIVAVMQSGIRPLSGQGETRHEIQGERVVFAPLTQLAPKSDTKFLIRAQGIRPGDQRVRVQISADDLQQPITKEVSTKVYADE